jgi:hypothetical protein
VKDWGTAIVLNYSSVVKYRLGEIALRCLERLTALD